MSEPLPLRYREFGDGKPVLILHGLFGSGRNWQAVAQRLAACRRVLAVDLRNHGDSPHSEIHDYPALAADILALIRALRLRDVTLVGHSMGGKAAMWLALLHPEAVCRLAVVDIAPVAYSDRLAVLLDALLALPIASIRNRREADRLLAAAIPEPVLRQFLLQNLISGGEGYRWRANLPSLAANRRHITGFPIPGPEMRYDGPALFIRGERSDCVAARNIEAIHRYFPRAAIATVRDAGHWPHTEQPEAFYRILADFILRSPDGPGGQGPLDAMSAGGHNARPLPN